MPFRTQAGLHAQFMTEIDGLEIHFIHARSAHEDALPLIMTHGWPGSVMELLETIGPLTDPTAHGGSADEAFHLVLPSVPGYGFSGEPCELGWNLGRVAAAWAELMRRLGYERYVAQGGEWVRASPTPWAAWGRRGWSASTPTCWCRR
jgi:pimeloyl-ACP methyl ester carboxylesterase